MNTPVTPITPDPRLIEVRIPCDDVQLEGDLVIPPGAQGLVLFAHGSGSSRRSPRNRMVAGEMHHKGLATLLFDLLTPAEARDEAETGLLRFDIPFLTERLVSATRWAGDGEVDIDEPLLGYFGASTGAAAALAAAARIPEIKAVVSRGGRTDLAGPAVEQVRAATLLIVGDLDRQVMEWNRETYERLGCVKQLSVIPGATHLFAERGALENVAELAASWLKLHMTKP
jgi:dienelactone hydrolase